MDQQKIYNLYNQHANKIADWYDDKLMEVLSEVMKQGYIHPRCYVMYYDFKLNRYNHLQIDLEINSLLDPVKATDFYETLQQIDRKVPTPVIGLMFCTEGSTTLEGSDEKIGFLVVTFEDHIRGWKNMYQLRKHNIVTKAGATRVVTETIAHDPEASLSTKFKEVERFAHILRPNWSDSANTVYN